MLTRARRRREDDAAAAAVEAGLPKLCNLSDDLLLVILQLLPLTSRVSVSGAHKNLHRVANQGSLWTELSVPLDSTLGDQALARLLKRVDAKNHMVSLSLVGCWRVTGAGLYPLEGSTVLRSIDFRRATLARGTLLVEL